jgi:signal transduction histidine kinase
MGSLFSKIFLAFWLSLILLGVALFSAQRQLGDRELESTRQWLTAHADTAAGLHASGGIAAVQTWLRGLRHTERRPVFLLDEAGRPLLRQRPHRDWRSDIPMQAGVHKTAPGRFLILVELPDTRPALLLGTMVDLGRLAGLAPPVRIAIALAVSGLVSLLLAAMLSRPLRRLRRAAQALAAGDLEARAGGHGRDEIGALARDFDYMADRMRGMLDSQRRLLRDVSHELRSPLARLRVALELAEQNPARPDTLARIGKEADELERLVTDLLSLARLESGQVELQRTRLSLSGLLKSVVTDADFEAGARQRRVELRIREDGHVMGDAVLLRSAIENVVRNAVRHSPEQGCVEVELRGSGGELCIEVRDRGEGVPETELARMFEPFTRIAEARDRHSGGFGLGLSITGQVLAAHGGRVEARNREEGGLCVRLCLPACMAAGQGGL